MIQAMTEAMTHATNPPVRSYGDRNLHLSYDQGMTTRKNKFRLRCISVFCFLFVFIKVCVVFKAMTVRLSRLLLKCEYKSCTCVGHVMQ